MLETIYDRRGEPAFPFAILDEMRRVLEVKIGVDPRDIDGVMAKLEELNPSMPATPPTSER